MQVLDDMGDQSPSEKRRKYFEEIDEDGSGAIDFEEYMGVRDWKYYNFIIAILYYCLLSLYVMYYMTNISEWFCDLWVIGKVGPANASKVLVLVNLLTQPTNCLSVFDYFEGLALKGLTLSITILTSSTATAKTIGNNLIGKIRNDFSENKFTLHL